MKKLWGEPAQECLAQQYPVEHWTTVQEVNLVDQHLTGELNLLTFHQLTTLSCAYNQLTALHLTHNSHLQWLDCHGNQLTNLDLSANNCLQKLDCQHNQLTSLDLSTNHFLQWLDCSWNQLTTLDLTQNLQLTSLDLTHNNFHCDLSFLSHLVNLIILDLSTNSFDGDLSFLSHLINLIHLSLSFNNFHGDLTPLANLTKLRELWLSNTNLTGSLQPLAPMSELRKLSAFGTNLDTGLEFLPASLELFSCDPDGPLSQLFKQVGIETELMENDENFSIQLKFYKQSLIVAQLEARTGDLSYLETKVQELVMNQKELMQKVIEAFTHLAPEAELLRKIIQEQLAYCNFKKRQKGQPGYGQQLKKYQRVIQQWESELLSSNTNEELEDRLSAIMDDLETIVMNKIVIEESLSKKALLLVQQDTAFTTQQHNNLITTTQWEELQLKVNQQAEQQRHQQWEINQLQKQERMLIQGDFHAYQSIVGSSQLELANFQPRTFGEM